MKPKRPGRLAVLTLVVGLAAAAPALAQPYSIRFFGTGSNDIDRIKIPIDPHRPVDVSGDFTIEFWMKANAGDNDSGTGCRTGNDGWITSHTIVDRDIFGGGDFGDYGISLGSDGRVAFGVAIGGGGAGLCSSTAVNDGAWHHVAVTRVSASGQMRIYVDGVQRAEGTGPTGDISYRNGRSATSADDPFLVFGAEKHDAGNAFPSYSGLLDEVRVSRVVRYTSNFTRPSAPFTTDGNTVGLYHLDEGPGAQTAIDASGASGGPSHGTVRYGTGGQSNRPSWSTDVPFAGGPPPCTYTLSASSANIGAGVVNGAVTVTAPGGCAWTATTNSPSWLTITGGLPGSGSGPLSYRAAANPNSTPRTGILTIAGKTFTVTQAAAAGGSCEIDFTPKSVSVGAAGGTGTVNIITAAGCPWSAETRAPKWLQILSATSGTGPAFLSYRVLPNASATSRDSTLRISGLRFRVKQDGVACAVSVSPASSAFGSPGGSGMFNVTAAAGCEWTAAPNVSWLTIDSGSSGSGNGTVEFTVAPKTTTGSRSGALNVAGSAHSVSQQGVSASTIDSDGDGLPDDWETRFGLNPESASGQNGASGDPDNDGLTNAEEFAAGTHPRGVFRRYLAEGATGSFFGMRVALANPGDADASVVVRFQPRAGSPVSHFVSLPAESRATVYPESLGGLGAAELATVVESNVRVVVDRTMWWDGTGYGAHAETALPAPALQWYLSEGATHSGFRLFYLLQNPSPTQDAVVEVTYVRPDAPPLAVNYAVNRDSRFNIDVNSVIGLPPSDVSAILKVLSGPPIVVERAMYRDAPGRPFLAGHEAAGVTAPALRWYFAEGATGGFFDTFCLLMNPTDSDAEVRIRYLLPDGAAIDRTLTIPPMRRHTVWVDTVAPELASTATSIIVESMNGVPIVAERAMWWPLDWTRWTEAHATAGATTTASRWGLAEGEIGGPAARRTFLLIANTGPAPTTVRVTLLLEGGGTRIADVPIAAHARQTVDVAATFGPLPAARFGAVVESLDDAPLIVERAMYWNAAGEVWAAGTSALGMPLP